VQQRNTSGGDLILPTLTPPVRVPDGAVLEHPEPLAGFEPVDADTEHQKDTASDARPDAPETDLHLPATEARPRTSRRPSAAMSTPSASEAST
jgi:hypothetical protein